MKRFKLSLITLLVTLATLLTACGDGFSFTGPSFTVQTEPNPLTLGFQYDTEKNVLTIKHYGHTFNFQSRSGAMGATIEGYDIEFYDSSNNPIFVGDSVAKSSGSLSVYVPAGMTCDDLKANPDYNDCTANSTGAQFTVGPKRSGPAESQLVADDIIVALFELTGEAGLGSGGAVGANALMYFYGTDDIGRPFRVGPYQFGLINKGV
jgi:hypothetical protein